MWLFIPQPSRLWSHDDLQKLGSGSARTWKNKALAWGVAGKAHSVQITSFIRCFQGNSCKGTCSDWGWGKKSKGLERFILWLLTNKCGKQKCLNCLFAHLSISVAITISFPSFSFWIIKIQEFLHSVNWQFLKSSEQRG